MQNRSIQLCSLIFFNVFHFLILIFSFYNWFEFGCSRFFSLIFLNLSSKPLHELNFIDFHAKSKSKDLQNMKLIFFIPQSQMDDKDRTIRIQQSMLELYEKEKSKIVEPNSPTGFDAKSIETANSATQTDRVSFEDT